MSSLASFELHAYASPVGGRGWPGWDQATELDLPTSPDDARPAAQVLSIGQDEPDDVWVSLDPRIGGLRRVDREADAVAGFRPVRRRLSRALALLPRREGVLVNGLPALSLTVLGLRDNLLLSPGLHVYLTERVIPHVGPPTEKLLGKRCPFCSIEFTSDTRVVGHRCSDEIALHYETDESHPHVPAEERLNCFEKVKNCLSCGLPVTLHEYLAWDPAVM